MNIEEARSNMLKQQIRTVGVVEDSILHCLQKTPREKFVAPAYHDLAFADTALPIGHGEVMLCPKEEAQILQALNINSNENVLEVGTGSGYMTALLARMAKHVVSVDIIQDFMVPAAKRLTSLAISNVTLTSGNAGRGWEHNAPYDIIVITGSVPHVANEFFEQLNVGGRLFAIVGSGAAMIATLWTRRASDQWDQKKLFETVVPPLRELDAVEAFSF